MKSLQGVARVLARSWRCPCKDLFERIAQVFNHHLHLSGSEEMLLLRVAQFVKHGDEGRCACDGVHQQAASTTIGVVWEIRPCEVGLGGKGTFHGNYEL